MQYFAEMFMAQPFAFCGLGAVSAVVLVAVIYLMGRVRRVGWEWGLVAIGVALLPWFAGAAIGLVPHRYWLGEYARSPVDDSYAVYRAVFAVCHLKTVGLLVSGLLAYGMAFRFLRMAKHQSIRGIGGIRSRILGAVSVMVVVALVAYLVFGDVYGVEMLLGLLPILLIVPRAVDRAQNERSAPLSLLAALAGFAGFTCFARGNIYVNSERVLSAMEDCSDDCVGVAFDVAKFMAPSMDMANFGWLVALIPVLALAYRCAAQGFWNRRSMERVALTTAALLFLVLLDGFTLHYAGNRAFEAVRAPWEKASGFHSMVVPSALDADFTSGADPIHGYLRANGTLVQTGDTGPVENPTLAIDRRVPASVLKARLQSMGDGGISSIRIVGCIDGPNLCPAAGALEQIQYQIPLIAFSARTPFLSTVTVDLQNPERIDAFLAALEGSDRWVSPGGA